MRSQRSFTAGLLHFVLFSVCLWAGTANAAGKRITVLYSFTGLADGGFPIAGLTLHAGALYGTTTAGGNFQACNEGGTCGLVYKLAPSSTGLWTETPIYDFQFQDPSSPYSNLVFDRQGNIYGAAQPGTSGEAGIFQLTLSGGTWTLNPIYSAGGETPLFETVSGRTNMFVIGAGTCCGSVVQLSPQPNGAWNPTTLYAFAGGNDGNEPKAGVVADSAGNLYGSTIYGGNSNCGTVFELSAQSGGNWPEMILHSFTVSEGCYPGAGIVLDRKGNIYGTTVSGGSGCAPNGCGVVFELTPPTAKGGTWTESVIHSFDNTDGSSLQAGLTISSTGVLYGTTTAGGNGPCLPAGAGCGTVFRLTPPATLGGSWTHRFVSFYGPNGQQPLSTLLLDESSNVLYGTTRAGGAYGFGTVFRVLF
jgi:uncharacterized repeat protein (TIGR03803 family)